MSYRVKSVEVHATGLRLPTHLGLTTDGQLLVSEFAGRAVRDVTKPGDYGECRKGQYVDGLIHPGGILPLSSGDIIIADSGAGAVYDISKKGDASRADALFDG